MKRSNRTSRSAKVGGAPETLRPAKRKLTWFGTPLAVAALAGALVWLAPNRDSGSSYVRRPAGTLTFNKDIAPIVFKHCVECHRPGQSAPFSLLNYADIKKRADLIVDVTARLYMPPWLAAPGYGEFAGTRRLTAEEIGRIRQWNEEGCAEGNPAVLLGVPRPWWQRPWLWTVARRIVERGRRETGPVWRTSVPELRPGMVGVGLTVAQQYQDALRRYRVSCEITGNGFLSASDDVDSGIEAVRDLLRAHAGGKPKLLVLSDRLPNPRQPTSGASGLW